MDRFEELLKFLFSRKNLPTIVLFLVAIFVAVKFSVTILVPKYQSLVSLKSEIAKKKTEYENLQKKKEMKDKEAKRELVKFEKVPVKIYKSATPGLPVESASIDFVSTILQMLERTDNTVLDISYKIDVLSDAEKNAIPSGVSVVQLIMSLNGTYTSFMDFVSMLYDYDYLATIKSLKMTPLKENKNVLQTNVVVWLYVSQ